MIRRIINLDDVDAIALKSLGTEFYVESRMPGEFNFEHFMGSMRLAMDAKVLGLWVLEHNGEIIGAIGGLLAPNVFTGKMIAVESFWFVTEKCRRGITGVRLLYAFIDWAVESKATAIHMAYMCNIHPEHMAKFYMTSGFFPHETMYVRYL
jgi:hypothetical protein